MDYKIWRARNIDKIMVAKQTRLAITVPRFPIPDDVRITCHDLGISMDQCPFDLLSNGQLLRMVYNFNIRCRYKSNSELIGKLSKLVAAHNDYFIEFRKYYNLDHEPGWLRRHIKTYASHKINRRRYYLWFIIGAIGFVAGLIVGFIIK